MCGGRLLIATCSHVGHTFRDKSPYSFPGGVSKIILHNTARVAHVWLDAWKQFYFEMSPGPTYFVAILLCYQLLLILSTNISALISVSDVFNVLSSFLCLKDVRCFIFILIVIIS